MKFGQFVYWLNIGIYLEVSVFKNTFYKNLLSPKLSLNSNLFSMRPVNQATAQRVANFFVSLREIPIIV